MIKDGLREMVGSDLHRVYDQVVREPVPQAFLELLGELK